MNANSFKTLEFERIETLLLQLAGSAEGRSRLEALRPLQDADWVLFTETAARFVLGFAQEEAAKGVASVLRACVTNRSVA